MNPSPIPRGITYMGVNHPERRLFDSLIPIPEGTSYNSWIVEGSQASVLLDTVEPEFADSFLARLDQVAPANLRYVLSHHAEQDHAGTLEPLLRARPHLEVLGTSRCIKSLADHLDLPAGARLRALEDGEVLSLGDRTLELLHAPWVHWPETALTWLREDQVLFSCDLFGSHLAHEQGLASQEPKALAEARRYYATIMMPFAAHIRKHLERIAPLAPRLILPSHGPAWDQPSTILGAHQEWTSGRHVNRAVVVWVSMHGSTARLVEHLTRALEHRGVAVSSFDLAHADEGLLAAALVDSPTLLFGSPTVLSNAHPRVHYAAALVNTLKPPVRYVGVLGSFAWGGRMVDALKESMPRIKAEYLDPVMVKGLPRPEHLTAIDQLADQVAERHRSLNPSPPA